jgi:O-antigen/teichoic acid export membrane protein
MNEEFSHKERPRGRIITVGFGLLISRLAQPFMSFALFAVVARSLSLEELGAYVALLSLMTILQTSASLGLGPLLIREVSLDLSAAGSWLGAAAMILAPAALINWLIFPGCAALLGYQKSAVLGALILGSALPFACGVQIAESVFLGQGQVAAVAWQSLLENAFRVILSLIVLCSGGRLFALLTAHAVSRAVGFGLAALFLRRLPAARPLVFDWPRARVLLSGVPTFGLMTVIGMISIRLDVIVLSVMCSESEVGLYGAAYRLLAMAFLLPESLVGAIFPVLARKLAESRQEARALFKICATLLLTIELPLCLTVVGLSSWLAPLLFGAKFNGVGPLLSILIFVLLPHSLNSMLGYLLQADHQENAALVIVITSFLTILGLDLTLIRWLGMVGAAWGTLISASVMAGLLVIVVNAKVFPLDLLGSTARLLAAALVGGAMVSALPLSDRFYYSLLPGAAYVITLMLLGGVNRDWLDRVWEVIVQRRE